MRKERVRRIELREILLPIAIYEVLVDVYEKRLTVVEAIEQLLYGDGFHKKPAPLPSHVKKQLEYCFNKLSKHQNRPKKKPQTAELVIT